jgi:hypothetical protein
LSSRKDVVPPGWLQRLRTEYEELVRIQQALWRAGSHGANAAGGSGGGGGDAPMPKLNLSMSPLAEHMNIGPATIGTVEFWAQSIHTVSSELLGVNDAAPNQMMLLCNPVRDHNADRDWNGWRRDFSPACNAPLESHAADMCEGGPRYLQWNVALYDDDVLQVIPNSHLRPASVEQDRIMRGESAYGQTH